MAPRTFVGFSDGMSLDHFELAAFEAGRISILVRERLCELAGVRDPELDAVLRAGVQLEITAIRFTREDAGAADVHLERADQPNAQLPGAGSSAGWKLTALRGSDGVWRFAVSP